MQQSVFTRGTWAVRALLALLSMSCRSDKHEPAPRDAGVDAAKAGSEGAFPDAGLAEVQPVGMPDAALPDTRKLTIAPADMSVTLTSSDPAPITFAAALSGGTASALPVRWSLDRRELGAIDPTTGVFTPSGAAGELTISAVSGSLGATLTLHIAVKLAQEGDPDAPQTPAGAGGLGGVGGEGGGSTITDMALRAALDAPATDDPDVSWLYPYDGTVWPRGLPAPLLQWRHGTHEARAVKLRIEVAPDYEAVLYLGAPVMLDPSKAIDHLPIPQRVWRNATASGKTMKVSLTIAASDGGGGYKAFAAKSSLNWEIAQTTLRGVVYYNSYGTSLAQNFSGAMGGDGRFGGATLAIQRDAFDPMLIAGSTSSDSSGCRVCHTVSTDGSTLIAQQANNRTSSAYDLRNTNKERAYPKADDGKLAWAALSADGSIALGSAGPPGDSPLNTASLAESALYKVSDASELTARGLHEFVTQAATPTFSLDQKHVAFNLYQGPGTSSIAADGKSLVMMDLTKLDETTYDFSNPRALYTAGAAGQMPGWPAFLPDGSGVVFELELKTNDHGEHLVTRSHARAELWWTDMDGHAHALERANGKGYLTSGPLGHDDDATLQYEPTIAPLVAGGYAWVVFTSRRAYGNVATRDPFDSDPRFADLTVGNAGGPTTKKLWVSALSMPPKPGTDPSHPAFYLPAQELYAGNSRGYWVLDACKETGQPCTGGDECCGGYCNIDVEFGGICADMPHTGCALELAKCNVDADCCPQSERLYCIANHCAKTSINLQ